MTRDELAAVRPFVGRLSVHAGHERWGKRVRSALLYDPAASRSLAELHCVELLKISERGMVLTGVEEVSAKRNKGRELFRQSWWCRPAAPTLTPAPDTEDLEQVGRAIWPADSAMLESP